jgi:hypothetical protein
LVHVKHRGGPMAAHRRDQARIRRYKAAGSLGRHVFSQTLPNGQELHHFETPGESVTIVHRGADYIVHRKARN